MNGAMGELGRVLVLGGGHNTSMVMLGVALLGAVSGVVGCFTLLRGRALLCDAVSHAALPGVCVAFLVAPLLGMERKSMPLLLIGAGVFSWLAALSVRAMGVVRRWKADAAVAAALSVFFALGVVLLSVIQGMRVGDQAGLQSFIFGQAAAMGQADVWRVGVAGALGLGLVVLLQRALKVLCFDEAYARSMGWRVGLADGALMMLVVVVAALGMQSVGLILIVAMLIIPAAGARFWTERLWVMLCAAGLMGAGAGYVGAAISAVQERLPTGPIIVLCAGGLFGVSAMFAPARGVAATWWRRIAARRSAREDHLLRALHEAAEVSGGEIRESVLTAARSWSPPEVRRRLLRAAHEGIVERRGAGWALTKEGAARAREVARRHRLWELYMLRHAEVASTHVDRSADFAEHVLDKEIVRELEEALAEEERARGAVASPHPLAGARGDAR